MGASDQLQMMMIPVAGILVAEVILVGTISRNSLLKVTLGNFTLSLGRLSRGLLGPWLLEDVLDSFLVRALGFLA